MLPAPSHTGRDHRRLGLPDHVLVLGSGKLLSLKIMLGGRPNLALQFNRMRREVLKLAGWLVQAIKTDLVHGVSFALYSAITSINPTIFLFISTRSSAGIHNSRWTDAPTCCSRYRARNSFRTANRVTWPKPLAGTFHSRAICR